MTKHTHMDSLFNQPCIFLRSVVDVSGLPADGLPEVAFAGRSNVGKSSLINALTGRRNLARTSSTPGHTQQLNFFNQSDQIYLVDLPGYGYAKAPRKAVEQWTQLIYDYLRGRRELLRLFLLIDGRHGIKANDAEMMAFLDDIAVTYQIVLTKQDKLPPSKQEDILHQTRESLARHGAAMNNVIFTSSEKNTGITLLRQEIAALASPV